MRLSPNAQAANACLLGAILVAMVIARGKVFLSASILLISFAILMGGYFLVVRLIGTWAKSDKLYKQVSEEIRLIGRMPTSDAKRDALALLSDQTKFTVIGAVTSAQVSQPLGKELREFFDRFESVTALRGETTLSRNAVAPSSLRSGFFRLGTDSEFAEIVARPEEDSVFLIDGTESNDPPPQNGYPSIYHFLLAYYGDSSPESGS